jgi:CheY-like chemotaxis protein
MKPWRRSSHKETMTESFVILYVEDNEPNITLAKRVLSLRPQVTLVVARDGSRGLEAAQKSPPAASRSTHGQHPGGDPQRGRHPGRQPASSGRHRVPSQAVRHQRPPPDHRCRSLPPPTSRLGGIRSPGLTERGARAPTRPLPVPVGPGHKVTTRWKNHRRCTSGSPPSTGA